MNELAIFFSLTFSYQLWYQLQLHYSMKLVCLAELLRQRLLRNYFQLQLQSAMSLCLLVHQTSLDKESNRIRRKSILTVDDERDILDIIKHSLQREEFKVCTFIDPFAALAHVNSDSKHYHHIVLSISGCQA
jgi:PleD family two-component response regulator